MPESVPAGDKDAGESKQHRRTCRGGCNCTSANTSMKSSDSPMVRHQCNGMMDCSFRILSVLLAAQPLHGSCLYSPLSMQQRQVLRLTPTRPVQCLKSHHLTPLRKAQPRGRKWAMWMRTFYVLAYKTLSLPFQWYQVSLLASTTDLLRRSSVQPSCQTPLQKSWDGISCETGFEGTKIHRWQWCWLSKWT